MILVFLVLLSPVFVGAVKFHGCIAHITGNEVFAEAKKAYLKKLVVTKRAMASELDFVKCGVPDEIPAYFYGLPVGTEWRAFCAYIKDGSVLTSEEFSINKCRTTSNWEFVDEGFPKPVQVFGYDRLL
ncbi:hypothetical protein J2W42_006553 [Rhizobium tibeticum]|uniref:hypothetical protein n=1 Tax=Rhizobium tibeticum TaxID=501024 RepID=UPI00277EEA3C|nr:hypothetical protein [Rhizobium tibeticum]MDP9813678.1 hypothetical protein [Rhizobium tibeticum]